MTSGTISVERMMDADPHGRVALMLCESLLHALVEEGLISKDKAMGVITTVLELSREMEEAAGASEHRPTATRLTEMIAKSLDAKGAGPRTGNV